MSTSMQRRRVLSWIGASALASLAVTPALAEDRTPTPRMTEGPFYPRSFPKDTDADITRIEGHGAVALGTVLDVGEREGDPDFQGFGAVLTDADGRYAFRTIKPVPYPGHTPHIHFTVLDNGKRRLTSQMFVEGEQGNARDGLYRSLGRDAGLVTFKIEDVGMGFKGALDIVLA